MSPLDDELRAALRARADGVAPAPDPLGGIEQRARGLRRRRAAVTVAGAALAVTGIAVAVPVVTGDSGRKPSTFATEGPTTPAPSAAALDPAAPWAFRGTLSAGTRAHFASEWKLGHSGGSFTPLFGQTYEVSGQEEAAYVATDPAGRSYYGWVTGSESGAEFVTESTLDPRDRRPPARGPR